MSINKVLLVLLLNGLINMTSAMAEEQVAAPEEAVTAVQEAAQPVVDGATAKPKTYFRQNRVLQRASVVNEKSGHAFLNTNQSAPGVVKLKSGLEYKIIKAGTGPKPKENDMIKCQYKGALIDGTVFEESEAGKPATIKIALLTSGLKEALKLMPVGSKWEVYLPSDLGFGSAGKPPKVGPDAVLVYTLEVLEINGTGAKKS